jgi:hypothetical protein
MEDPVAALLSDCCKGYLGPIDGSVGRRSFAVVSPGMSGQTTARKRAPMLGKWPNPNKLSEMSAWARKLWIRRVLVGLRPPAARTQEGQLQGTMLLSLSWRRAFGLYAPCRISQLSPATMPRRFSGASITLSMEPLLGMLVAGEQSVRFSPGL